MDTNVWKSERVPGEVGLAIGRAGEGPDPLVCLHGITAQHRAFNAPARHLGPSRGLVGVDLRGRGNSDKPESGYGLATHASDVIRVLDHLGLEDAVLLGHSMGAFVAMKTALEFPDRVRALVLLDGGWPRVESSPEEMTEEEKQEAEAIEEGLARAFRRLDMVFESPEAYLDFWFPDQGLTMYDLPPDLADYYLYDLEKIEDGYNPNSPGDEWGGLSRGARACLTGLLPRQRPADIGGGPRRDGRVARHSRRGTGRGCEPLHYALA